MESPNKRHQLSPEQIEEEDTSFPKGGESNSDLSDGPSTHPKVNIRNLYYISPQPSPPSPPSPAHTQSLSQVTSRFVVPHVNTQTPPYLPHNRRRFRETPLKQQQNEEEIENSFSDESERQNLRERLKPTQTTVQNHITEIEEFPAQLAPEPPLEEEIVEDDIPTSNLFRAVRLLSFVTL
jgi:hypothetical protein